MKFINSNDVQSVIENSLPGPNTKFLTAAHSLWTRFKNYDKCPPAAFCVESKIVNLIFATHNHDGYANLYEIVTIQGQEGKGYASQCWQRWIKYASEERKSKRLKLSCTPSSVTWHYKNGLIFWAVDPTGSLRSDQPLYPTREKQLLFREMAIGNPRIALPSYKVIDKLRSEGLDSYIWGKSKKEKTRNAIEQVGSAWLRSAIMNQNTIDEFLI
jgi:hypothetical protein